MSADTCDIYKYFIKIPQLYIFVRLTVQLSTKHLAQEFASKYKLQLLNRAGKKNSLWAHFDFTVCVNLELSSQLFLT